MVADIRIVIRVPDSDREIFPETIDAIIAVIKQQHPKLANTTFQSPITVTIKEFDEPFGNLGKTDIET